MQKGLFLLPVIFFVALSGFVVSYEASTAPVAAPSRVYVAEKNSEASMAASSETPEPDGGGESASLPTLQAYPELADVSIDINTAEAAELEKLPGIGPTKADAIVAYVRANGPLESVDQLLNVKGIGEKTLEKIRPYLTTGTD